MNGIPTRYLELGVEMPDDCPECDGGEYLGNRNLVEYLVSVKTVLIFYTWNISLLGGPDSDGGPD